MGEDDKNKNREDSTQGKIELLMQMIRLQVEDMFFELEKKSNTDKKTGVHEICFCNKKHWGSGELN